MSDVKDTVVNIETRVINVTVAFCFRDCWHCLKTWSWDTFVLAVRAKGALICAVTSMFQLQPKFVNVWAARACNQSREGWSERSKLRFGWRSLGFDKAPKESRGISMTKICCACSWVGTFFAEVGKDPLCCPYSFSLPARGVYSLPLICRKFRRCLRIPSI